jgi:MFS family permease
MNILAFLARLQLHLEMWLVGPLDSDVRRNMQMDMRAARIHSVMSTTITFIPIILRRSGATTEQVAYYFAITALGLLTTNISVWFMRRWGMKRVALICWLVGRGSFLLTAIAFNATSLLIIFTFFWLLEAWPTPAYVQTIQVIYPIQQRGRILAAVRVGFVALILIFTPLAGWILDHWGNRALLPLAGISGIGSTLIFFSVMRKLPDTVVDLPRRTISPMRIIQTEFFYLGSAH